MFFILIIFNLIWKGMILMNNNNDKFIKVSYELLDMIDETKEYEL